MLYIQDKLKFLPHYSKLLFLMTIVICSLFINVVNAQTNIAGNNNTYFLDINRLEGPFDSGSLIIYIEKENHNKWAFIPIKISTKGYREAVAYVVATEFQRRVDEHSLVPHAKFLIKKTKNTPFYELLGVVYKKISFAAAIQEIMKIKNFNNYDDPIYKDDNIEHAMAMWSYLGLPISPSPAILELSEDNKLIRYDYYKSFQYNSEISEKCFCTADSEISNYSCNLNNIKTFVKALQSRSNKKILEKVISEIQVDLQNYLDKNDIYALGKGLEYISYKF